MAETIFEIPVEVRTYAELSVEQARKAFWNFAVAASEAKEVSGKALSYSEANIEVAFDFGRETRPSQEHARGLAVAK